ncbi:hypothetical protein AB0M72_10280 [Nocardiopsis dassonvillei]
MGFRVHGSVFEGSVRVCPLEFSFGLEKGFVHPSDVIRACSHYVSLGLSCDFEERIGTLLSDEEDQVVPLFSRWRSRLPRDFPHEDPARVWVFLVSGEVSRKDIPPERKLSAVEDLWAGLDYPDILLDVVHPPPHFDHYELNPPHARRELDALVAGMGASLSARERCMCCSVEGAGADW